MATLTFTLSPDGCGRFHDALTCLARFSDSVTLEALPAQLALTALNISKSAYVSFTFDASAFIFYHLSSQNVGDGRFSCQMLNKALSSVFKGRLVDPRHRDSALERCEVSVVDTPEQTQCRLSLKMICRHGVTKTYNLIYESVDTMRALFDKNRATNVWRIHSKHLREYIEFFAPKTEQLDIYAEEGKCTFLSFTEKISHGKEVLKQPLQTAVSIGVEDFLEFNVIDNLHVVIDVKDFKNMVMHAETLTTVVTAMYSQPSRPLQFSYSAEGMHCEFTLMTIGDPEAAPPTEASGSTNGEHLVRPAPISSRNASMLPNSNMPPPNVPSARYQTNLAQPRLGRRMAETVNPARQRAEFESLFVADDDDRRWEPLDERQGDQDMLGWDASGDNDASIRGTFRNGGSASRRLEDDGFDATEIPPTQRASEVRGIFD